MVHGASNPSYLFLDQSSVYHFLEGLEVYDRGVCGTISQVANTGQFSKPHVIQSDIPHDLDLCGRCELLYDPNNPVFFDPQYIKEAVNCLYLYVGGSKKAPTGNARNYFQELLYPNNVPNNWIVAAKQAIIIGNLINKTNRGVKTKFTPRYLTENELSLFIQNMINPDQDVMQPILF
jgi:hypothetical protein